MCYSEGKLQELIDGVLSKEESLQVKKHLLVCRKCRKLYNELKKTNEFVSMKIQKVLNSTANNKKGGLLGMLNKNRKVVLTATLAVIFLVSIIFTPFGKALSDALRIFRASSVEPIAITISDLQEIESKLQQINANSTIDLKQFGKIQFKSSENHSIYVESLNSAEFESAKNIFKKYNITPDEIAYLWQKENIKSMMINENPNIELEFRLDIDKVNQLLKSLGSKTLLPQALDQKEFVLTMEGALNLMFYPVKNSEESKKSTVYMIPSLEIGIVKVPKLTTPVELDKVKIYETIANLPFVPNNIRSQLLSIKDPLSTLPIPVNKDEYDYKKVSIAGNDGLIVYHKNNPNDSTIVWVDGNNSVKYIKAESASEQKLLELANLLK
ncbi:anti-sigma factor family protein [Caldicellulosiruptor acetigenus]|uniref:anti-sigma factor family protein n=1 Tax=Caldicellulosiruptor acetigenus TaxID=301953 RepID=UPI0004291035|nr:zf-HC2 domain-containing protein [Caldicellulosiruptor acetigenus]WAM37324.1 zf-HC2 domain-containing protein [Caldicellulosiruptor acetigenus]